MTTEPARTTDGTGTTADGTGAVPAVQTAGVPAAPPRRTASVRRVTGESTVELRLDLDGSGRGEVSTGVRFYDHMLLTLAKHALFDLNVSATGDTDIDAHHSVEDVAIVLGDALREALGDKRGISRFGEATVPLDETLVQAVVDLAGRPYVVHTGEPDGQVYALIGGSYTGSLTRHVFESFALHAGIALHVRVLSGRDPHHLVEAQFKAVARALRAAVAVDPRVDGVPSAKGSL
jgi:imidazoleglycerol-phosphate dehydratase